MNAVLRDRRFWLVVAAIAVLLASRLTGLSNYLSLDTLRAHRAALTAFVAAHYEFAAIAYIGIYILAVAFSLPGALFLTLAGGFLFGAVAGTIFTVIGATGGAIAVFMFARLLLGDNALARFGPQAEKLARNLKKDAWSYLLVLRLIPLFPFCLVNLIPVFAGVSLSTFALTTFIGIIPGSAVFSLAGAGLGDILDAGGSISISSILTPNILLGLTGLALLSLAAIPIRRKFAQKTTEKAGSLDRTVASNSN